MVLRPDGLAKPPNGALISAWEAVARTQRATSAKYHLVRQPDHARLSGKLAAQFAIVGSPILDDDIVRGITLHDEGWSDFDVGLERLHATPVRYSDTTVSLNPEGKPLSFLEIKAGDFLHAWRGSIAAAEAVAPIAGLIVSGHFRRIGQFGMTTGTYSNDDAEHVREFIAREDEREQRLLRLQGRSEREVEYWTDVLQFCDLLSLYLCCGAQESVEFPQRIGPKGETIRLQVEDDVNVLSPSPFARELKCSLEARPFPEGLPPTSATLTWRLR